MLPHIEALRLGLEQAMREASDARWQTGAGDVGPGLAAAPHAFGLSFVPLVEENYYLVCLKDVLDSPAVLRLRETLTSPSWRAALEGLPAYAPIDEAGEVLSLSKTLP